MEAEAFGINKGNVMGIEGTGQAGQAGGQGKDGNFIGRSIDPHDLGGDFMVPDGLQGPAVTGINQAVDQQQGEADKKSHQEQVPDFIAEIQPPKLGGRVSGPDRPARR